MEAALPDWRDAAQYPAEAPAQWWAWQFLRRNCAYQADYAQWAAAEALHAADFDSVDAPDESPLLERWGIRVLLDSADPAQHLIPLTSVLPIPLHRAMERPRIHEVVMKFDLRYPIDRQIEYAKGYLMQQVGFLDRVHQARGAPTPKFTAKGPHKRKLPEYLRALDAAAAGATLRAVAETLYPHLARELTRDPGITRAEAALARGRELVDSGYLDLMTWA